MIYSELERLKDEINVHAEELDRLLKDFSALIDSNVNNQEVWKGASSSKYKQDWDEFEQNFPSYIQGFKNQVAATLGTLRAYEKSEQ